MQNKIKMHKSINNYFSLFFQARTVAGFRGTVRYAAITAHENKVHLF